MLFLMVTSRQNEWSKLARGLETAPGVELLWAESGTAALQAAQVNSFDLILIDEVLEDMPGLDLAKNLIKSNPMLNCALSSALSKESFHEASEGLGLLAQLPLDPGEQQAHDLIEQVTAIIKLIQGAESTLT